MMIGAAALYKRETGREGSKGRSTLIILSQLNPLFLSLLKSEELAFRIASSSMLARYLRRKYPVP